VSFSAPWSFSRLYSSSGQKVCDSPARTFGGWAARRHAAAKSGTELHPNVRISVFHEPDEHIVLLFGRKRCNPRGHRFAVGWSGLGARAALSRGGKQVWVNAEEFDQA
jgi:hypothetical protein